MREIKFRVWDTIEERFLQWEDIQESTTQDLFTMYSLITHQFTGLLDKNGKEIYEGDVVSDEHGNTAVYWNSTVGAWAVQDSDDCAVWLSDYLDSVEVIGNIYENHDLIKP